MKQIIKNALMPLFILSFFIAGTALGVYAERERQEHIRDATKMVEMAVVLGVQHFLNEFAINYNRKKEVSK